MVVRFIGVVLGPEASVNREASVELAVGWSLRWGGAWVVVPSQGIDGVGAVVDAGSGGFAPPQSGRSGFVARAQIPGRAGRVNRSGWTHQNSKINLIICDKPKGWKLMARGSGQINLQDHQAIE